MFQTSDIMRWPSYAVSLFSLIKPRELFGLTYIHLCYQHIVATYMAPPRPVMYGRCLCSELVWYIHAAYIPHLVGQLLLLFVQVWWS